MAKFTFSLLCFLIITFCIDSSTKIIELDSAIRKSTFDLVKLVKGDLISDADYKAIFRFLSDIYKLSDSLLENQEATSMFSIKLNITLAFYLDQVKSASSFLSSSLSSKGTEETSNKYGEFLNEQQELIKSIMTTAKGRYWRLPFLHLWIRELQGLSSLKKGIDERHGEKRKLMTSSTHNNVLDDISMIPQFLDDNKKDGGDHDTTVHQPNHPTMDACNIIQDCFPKDYENEKSSCHRSTEWVLGKFDSAFMVKGAGTADQRIIGFISIDKKYHRQTNQHVFIIYNVCIAPDQRGKGIGKAMMTEFIDATIDHYKLRHLTSPDLMSQSFKNQETGHRPLLLGLSVDVFSKTFVDAMVLYVELGFIRLWARCSDANRFDWSKVYSVYSSMKNKKPSLITQQFLYGFNLYDSSMNSEIEGKDDLCMYKFYSDDWKQFEEALKGEIE